MDPSEQVWLGRVPFGVMKCSSLLSWTLQGRFSEGGTGIAVWKPGPSIVLLIIKIYIRLFPELSLLAPWVLYTNTMTICGVLMILFFWVIRFFFQFLGQVIEPVLHFEWTAIDTKSGDYGYLGGYIFFKGGWTGVSRAASAGFGALSASN